MKPTEAGILAKYCDANVIGNLKYVVKDVKIDSRACAEGDMFVCIIGEKNNGHNYVNSAYDQGCRCFLVSEKVALPSDAVLIEVKDTITAFVMMAEAYLKQFSLIKVGVTGSVGKTTTKMLTAAVLGSRYKTICTQKNYNTDIGNCITAFSADDTTRAIVFEMGMDEKGQIASYVKWIKPDLAIITNVGISHLERLGTRDEIANAKLEIVNEFTPNNVLVVNGYSDYLKTHREIRERAANKEHFIIISIGKDILLENIENDGIDGIKFKIKDVDFRLPLLGEHNAIDAALAVACGMNFGISIAAAARALSKVKATEKRLSSENLDGVLLIDDSYNASPDSVKAAISAISAVKAERRILVLGDMLELGSESNAGHKAVGRYAASRGIDLILAVGEKKDYYRQGVEEAASSCRFIGFDLINEINDYIKENIKSGDAILVKGSNSTHVCVVAEYIRENRNDFKK